jgi:Methyltransferase domain
VTDWVDWHSRYDDPTSVQARRLSVVRQRVGETLDELRGDRRRALSLCAGDGRDLIPELAARPSMDVEAVLIEANAELAEHARGAVGAAGLDRVEVRTADAEHAASFAGLLPVDLLLLCGIFGNVSELDIRTTIAAVPAMLRPGGFVIWTRGRFRGTDLRPSVRRWIGEAGLVEVAYDGEPELYGVGVARADATVRTDLRVPDRLFTFIR